MIGLRCERTEMLGGVCVCADSKITCIYTYKDKIFKARLGTVRNL